MNNVVIHSRHTIQTVIVLICASFLFWYGIHPVTTFDTFFGIEIGESVIRNRQLPFHEEFSWSAQGREWIPYEWLAQVVVFLLHRAGGIPALEVYVAVMIVVFFLVSFFLMRKALARDFFSSLLLSLLTTVSVYEFFVARPQIVSFLMFLVVLLLILRVARADRTGDASWHRLLWWTLPAMYLWTNSHGSFIIGLFFFFSYGMIAFLLRRPLAAKNLWSFGLLNTLVTLLPPLWHKPYVLLWQFASDLPFLIKFVSEWGPIGQNPTYQWFYVLLVVTTLCVALSISICSWLKGDRKHVAELWLLALPLSSIMLASFQAIRHVPLGTIAGILTLALFLPNFSFHGKPRVLNGVAAIGLIALVLWLGWQKKLSFYDMNWDFRSSVLARDVEIVKRLNLQGHMYNEFAAGGYFIHAFYPQYQVFFDGRADVYHCCEMRDFWPLIVHKKSTPDVFEKDVDAFLTKYQFSYMMIPVYTYNPFEFTAGALLVQIVVNRPDWRIVFASDWLQILVRDDGENDDLFRQGLTAATPYRFAPAATGKEQEALVEYDRLIDTADSGIARSGKGFILLSVGQLDNAREEFERAVVLNAFIGHPHLGLAKIAQQQRRDDQAIREAQEAIKRSPFLGEAYLVWSKADESQGRIREAITALEAGLKQDIDLLSRQKMVARFHELQRK